MNLGTTLSAYQDNQRLLNLLASYGVRERVISAFEKIPREIFVPQRLLALSYEDRALPIGEGQTISQPSLVASMIDALDLKGDERVLDIGTGSGFQAALLGTLAKEVYTIERILKLVKEAKRRIEKLGLGNITVITGDGSEGLPENAPYDAIIVAAASPLVPPPLIEQLKEKGKLVIPIGDSQGQDARMYIKEGKDLKEVETISPVRFVPLIGKYGWSK